MKKIYFILLLVLSISACKKDNTFSQDDIPNWLKERILEDEKIIASNPHSGLDIACWVRYEYSNNYYFEYVNLLSSSFPPVYDFDGKEYNAYLELNSDYLKNRCCKTYVWRGPSYIDIDN